VEPPTAASPAVPTLRTPTDDFGPDLKAWLDATKLQDRETAAGALVNLQRLRAERNITTVEDVAAAISGRAQVRGSEGTKGDALDPLEAALSLAPDSATVRAHRAEALGQVGEAWSAVGVAWDNALEHGRLLSALLLGLLIIGGLFAVGFSLAILLRYGAVFTHDVSEGLSGPLKSLALFMAVLFIALPLAGFLGWGYLPFWWVTLFFIFQSRAEKTVSVAILAALALSSLAIPMITHQRTVAAAPMARPLYLAANGGTSAEVEALVRSRLAEDPTHMDWSLLSASLSRRGGRFDEASTALSTRASADPRFAHNAAAFEFMAGNFAGAIPGFTQASEASLPPRDRATALYNLSLAQVNTLAFDESKESRRKGDALDGPALARYDRLFAFERDGSTLQAPPDLVPAASGILGSSIPAFQFTLENTGNRLTVLAVVLLLLIPAVVKFRGAQSFSKQCPKCGTTFCWLCQTRSTSQDVCSQCHHLFVVKRGVPPAARAAKNQEITRYTTSRALIHRVASLAAPGAGHLSVGHFNLGLPLLLVWAVSAGAWLTVQYLAPHVVSGSPLGSALKMGAGVLAGLAYVLAQVVKPRPPVVTSVQRRNPKAEQEA
jgi:tetratricopeptide (TPR) repeat protein